MLAFVSGVEDVELNLTRLLRAKIIHEQHAIPNREYAFTHGLLQEAALSTLTRSRRRELYRLLASAHEEAFADGLDDQLEILAFYHARGAIFRVRSTIWSGRRTGRRRFTPTRRPPTSGLAQRASPTSSTILRLAVASNGASSSCAPRSGRLESRRHCTRAAGSAS